MREFAWLRDVYVFTEVSYYSATDKWEKLHGGGVSFVKRFRIAIEFRDLAKEAFRAAKVRRLPPQRATLTFT